MTFPFLRPWSPPVPPCYGVHPYYTQDGAALDLRRSSGQDPALTSPLPYLTPDPVASEKMGRYREITIAPTTTPMKMMSTGSSREVRL